MSDIKRRVEKLEKEAKPKDPLRVVVDWSENPQPPEGENVKVITWDDIENED